MSFAACLAKLVDEGTIDPERGVRFREEYDRLNRAYGKTMGEIAAADLAGRDTLDALERSALVSRRQTMLQIRAQASLLDRMTRHVEGGGKAGHFATSVMEHHEAVADVGGVENRRAALFQLAWSRMDGFLSRYNRDMIGRIRKGDELNELVRVLRGEKSDNPNAIEMGAAVADTMEWLRQQFNLAGGDIAKLDGWGLPQNHDALAVAQAGFDDWWTFHKDLLDPARMIDNTTGKAFASEEALAEAAESAWRNITSHGMDGQVPGAFTGQGKMANRRSDHRFFVYKDADSWLAYNERFGTGGVLDAVTGHIDSMTRDIAAMQALGPNPALTMRWLTDMLRQDAMPTLGGGKALKLEKNARKGADVLGNMWDYYSGTLTAVPPEYRGQARFFSGVRNLNVATKLGGAYLSAVASDPVFMGMTANFNRLPVTGVMTDYARLMNPADASHRALAEHTGLIFNDMITRGEAMYRQGSGFNVHELTRRGADLTLRASLLTPHTVAAKQALGLGFMKDWGEAAGRDFDQLHPVDQERFAAYGIGADDWDRLRGAGVFVKDGVSLLRPGDLARQGDGAAIETATRFFAMIDNEVRFGVPGESLRASSAIAALNNPNSSLFRRGTAGGELLHSAKQFKTYSAIMITTQLQRALYGRGNIGRAGYAVLLPTLLTLSGAVANMMIDVFNGKDPSPLGKTETWARAFFRGGGAGIVGDLLNQGLSGDKGTGGAVSGFVVGPTFGSVIDPLYNLTFGNLGEAAHDKDMHLSSELARQARNNVPGNNVWYLRAAYNRMWADQLQEIADPNYRQSWRRMERRAAEQGTEFFWRPGETRPDRAPDFSNALEGNSP